MRMMSAGLLLAGALWSGAAQGGSVEYQAIKGVTPEKKPGGLPARDELEQFMDALMRDQAGIGSTVVGGVVAVVKDGALVFAKGYGCADAGTGRTVDSETTLFQVASVSKLFTWTALMQLVERGQLRLSDPVDQYLDFPIPATYGPITIANLLTHTAGFEENFFGFTVKNDPADLVPLRETLMNHIPARVRPPADEFSAGHDSSYSNWAAALAGYIVARVTGTDFDRYVQEQIFDRLGMDRSTFQEPLPAGWDQDLALGHRYVDTRRWDSVPLLGGSPRKHCGPSDHEGFAPVAREYFHSIGPAASLTISAPDAAKFMIAHLARGGTGEHKIFDKPETADLMHGRAMGGNPQVNGSALGLWEIYRNGRRVLVHEGRGSYAVSIVALIPEEKVGLFMAFNSATAVAAGEFLKTFMDRYFPAEDLPAIDPPASSGDSIARFAGTYLLSTMSGEHIEKAFALVAPPYFEYVVTPTDHATLKIAHMTAPGETNEWEEVPGRPGLFRETQVRADGTQQDRQDTIAFVTDDRGQGHLLRWLAFGPAEKVTLTETPTFHFNLLVLAAMVFCLGAAWPAAGTSLAHRLAAAISVGNLVAFGALWNAFGNPARLLVAFPWDLKLALAMLIGTMGLSAAFVAVVAAGFRHRRWSATEGALFTLFTLFTLAFFWSLNQWNLIGFKFA